MQIFLLEFIWRMSSENCYSTALAHEIETRELILQDQIRTLGILEPPRTCAVVDCQTEAFFSLLF